MFSQLLFILCVGALIAWCGSKDPRGELRRARAWRPSLQRQARPAGHRPTGRAHVGSGHVGRGGPAPVDDVTVSDAEWSQVIAGLSDLADLDLDSD